MFSRRLNWRAHDNALSQALASHKPRYDLTASNPTTCGLDIPAAIAASFDHREALVYTPDPRGLAKAREAIGLGEHSLLAASTSEAYAWLFKLLCDPGDEVLVPRPSYPLFEFLGQLECVNVRQYSLRYAEGWWLDFESLKNAITPRTRALLFVHPNNPTGQFLKKQELDHLAALCAEKRIALISDEVFAEYPLIDDETRCATLGGNGRCLTFVLGGLSKTAGLPQMKIAWLTASGPGASEAARALELIADTYLSVSTPVQLAVPALLHHGAAIRAQIQQRTRANFARVRREALHVEGGWYVTIPTPRSRTEDEWTIALLIEHGVLTQPGYFYDFESDGWLVISLLTPEADFEAGLSAISYSLRNS
ncbi:MAG: pyridoxal phosphate-dependent aminotransferase [Acidobacteria bacterium]|nr:pyridoxal phosphate-dependent aminotransferase [Acidobacteriota bacterium]